MAQPENFSNNSIPCWGCPDEERSILDKARLWINSGRQHRGCNFAPVEIVTVEDTHPSEAYTYDHFCGIGSASVADSTTVSKTMLCGKAVAEVGLEPTDVPQLRVISMSGNVLSAVFDDGTVLFDAGSEQTEEPVVARALKEYLLGTPFSDPS